jgi:hypothetical protein
MRDCLCAGAIELAVLHCAACGLPLC